MTVISQVEEIVTGLPSFRIKWLQGILLSFVRMWTGVDYCTSDSCQGVE